MTSRVCSLKARSSPPRHLALLGLTTWERMRIKHDVIDPEKLLLHPIDNGVWPTEQQQDRL